MFVFDKEERSPVWQSGLWVQPEVGDKVVFDATDTAVYTVIGTVLAIGVRTNPYINAIVRKLY